MAVTVVQSAHTEASSAAVSIGLTLTGITSGNTLIALVSVDDTNTISNVKDDLGNTFAADKQHDDTTQGQWIAIYSFPNITGTSRTITATFSSSGAAFRALQVLELSGLPATASLSGTPGANDSGSGTATAFDSSGTSRVTAGANGAIYIEYSTTSAHPQTAAGSFAGTGIGETTVGTCSGWFTQTTAAALDPSFTVSPADKWSVLLAAYAPTGGGATSKTDTDTATVTETAAALTNKTTGTPDTATLTEQAPQIALSAQPDSFTLAETQTVTVGGVTSKTDTDTASLTETAPGPMLQTSDTAAVVESALTLIVTDVQAIPDFTVTEQTPQIGVSQADSLTFGEQQTLTASFIRWVDTDAFGLAEATPRIDLSLTDALSLTERVPALSQSQTDTAGLTDAQAVSALLHDLDTGTFLESQTVTVIGGFTGYAKGLLTVQDRLGGVLTSSARLTGTLTGQDRLQGITTVQPVGPP